MKILKEQLFEGTKKQYYTIDEICDAWEAYCEHWGMWKFRDFEDDIKALAKLADLEYLAGFVDDDDEYDRYIDIANNGTPNERRSARGKLVRNLLYYAESDEPADGYVEFTTKLLRRCTNISKAYNYVFYNCWEEPFEYTCYLNDEEYDDGYTPTPITKF